MDEYTRDSDQAQSPIAANKKARADQQQRDNDIQSTERISEKRKKCRRGKDKNGVGIGQALCVAENVFCNKNRNQSEDNAMNQVGVNVFVVGNFV